MAAKIVDELGDEGAELLCRNDGGREQERVVVGEALGYGGGVGVVRVGQWCAVWGVSCVASRVSVIRVAYVKKRRGAARGVRFARKNIEWRVCVYPKNVHQPWPLALE